MGCSDSKKYQRFDNGDSIMSKVQKVRSKEIENKLPIYNNFYQRKKSDFKEEMNFCIPSDRSKSNGQKRKEKWKLMIQTGLSLIKDKEQISYYCNQREPFNNHQTRNKCNEFTEAESELGLYYFMKENSKIFLERVRKGPPDLFRWLAWKTLLSFPLIFQKGIYGIYKSQLIENEFNEIIKKDVLRTFVNINASDEKENQTVICLQNILKVYSLYNKNVGYCQGMHFIGAMLLLVSNNQEEETFWAFVSLMENNLSNDPIKFDGLQGCYKNYFPQLQVINGLFKLLVYSHFPSIFPHLTNLEYFEIFFLIKWTLSLFLYEFPFEFCIRIWDYIFTQGLSFVLTFSAALLFTKEHEILQSDYSKTYKIISNIKNDININNLNYLLKYTKSLKINWKVLESEKIRLESQIKTKIMKEESTFQTASQQSNSLFSEININKQYQPKTPTKANPKVADNLRRESYIHQKQFTQISNKVKLKINTKLTELNLNIQKTEETSDMNCGEFANFNLENEGLQSKYVQERKNSNIMDEAKTPTHVTLPILTFPSGEDSLILKEKRHGAVNKNSLINTGKNTVRKESQSQMLNILNNSLKTRSINFNKRMAKLDQKFSFFN